MVLDGYNKELCVVIERLGRTNRRLQLQVVKRLTEYKHSRRPATNKTQQNLYYRSIQHLKDNLITDLAMQLITYRLRQFARYFSYMWNNPSLNIKTYNRLSKKYPYKSTHYLRSYKILSRDRR
jgi:hypothetical protein